MIGTTLAHYQIVARIGAGGMGEVYRARDTKLNRDVAIKVLPEAVARNPDRMKRFEREAQVLASLNHPNIASIYGLEENALVLELVEGPTLAERLQKGALTIEEVVPIARQITQGLEAAHEKGIIHRDLKPANVKLTAGGDVKILDFGLAKAMDAEGGAKGADVDGSNSPTMTRAATAAGVLLGTAAYMSPEQARGKTVDKRADVWAFGCVLYEMLTGKRLFDGETVSDTLAAVLTREPDFTVLPAGTPEAVRRVLARCLERNVKNRFHDIADVRIDLTESTMATPSTAASASAAGSATRATRLIPVVALVAAAGAFFLGYFFRGSEPSSPSMRLNVEISPEAPLDTSFLGRLAISPDGTRLAFVAGTEGDVHLYLRRLDQLTSVRLDGTKGARQPFFSPDGQFIGFFADGRIWKVALDGGAPSTIAEIGTDNARGATWGPDDAIVFSRAALSAGLERVAASGGTPSVLTSPERQRGERHRWPHFLPGGRALLFNVLAGSLDFDEARVEVLELPGGRRKLVLEGGMAPRYVSSGHLVFVRAGVLYAAPFDRDRLETTGPAVPVAEGIQADIRNGSAQFATAEGRRGRGVLAYIPGESPGLAGALVWADRQGRMSPLRERPDNYVSPRFSPDGEHLAFALGPPGKEDLWMLEVAGGTPRRFTFEQAGDRQPIWTPDGERIVFGGVRDGTPGLFWKRADGAGSEERLFATDVETNDPSPEGFSPDGRLLIFRQTDGLTPKDIWVLRLDEEGPREPQVLVRTPDPVSGAAVSPDGRWLAYGTAASIYVQSFGGGEGRWQVAERGFEPRWSRDGRELFFRGSNAWWVVPVRVEGASLILGTPEKLFEGRFGGRLASSTWDVTPDAQRFAILQQSVDRRAHQTHATFVFDWFQELERLAPPDGPR